MRSRVFRTTCVGLLFSASWAAVRVMAEEKFEEKQETIADGPFAGTPTATFEAWKIKYAFQSLRDRLAYEKSVDRGPPKLSTEAAEHLKQVDANQEFFRGWSRRSISLSMLHGENVEKFTKAAGFGLSRMAPPGPTYLQERPETPQIPFARVTPLSEDEASPGAAAPLPKTVGATAAEMRTWKLPAAEEAFGFHRDAADYFTQQDRSGYVKSVDQVAGFESHAVTHAFPPPVDAAQVDVSDKNAVAQAGIDKRWKVARLELVSLLKHETPRVYLSEHLPRMEELSSKKTRSLTGFEAAALKRLVDGEDLDTASTPNRIEMLGSLRASKQCAECHQVPHGTLLGAFSYELRRDPPIKVEAATVAPVQ
jgi:hypothetical protein